MNLGQKANPLNYALRLHNIVTKEVIWMPRNTTIKQVIAHILNPSCPNADCPNNDRNTDSKLSQKKSLSNVAAHGNSVWRAELRVRYVPQNLRDLYEKDKTTCHFYFDQVRYGNASLVSNIYTNEIYYLGETRLYPSKYSIY